MSFRGRLLVFFTIIVVIPMIAVALVLFSLTEDSEHGKVDSRLAGGLHTTLSFYDAARADARALAGRVASDDALLQALQAKDEPAATSRLQQLGGGIKAVAYFPPGSSRAVVAGGSQPTVAAATVEPTTAAGESLGTLAISTTTAQELARRSAQFTDLDVRVLRNGRVLATTIPGAREPTAESGDVEIGDQKYRARVQEVPDGPGPPTELHVLEDASEMQSSIDQSRLVIGALLVAFLGLSLASSVFVVRALQAQIDNFLQAARRLGGGDLSERVPVQGDDEFAALGQEFNTMAGQLEDHVEEVERKRRELEDSIRRIGEAFGTGLDRQGIVDLAVRTAIQACNAEAGRLIPVDPRELEEVRLVDDPGLLQALEAAERQVLAPGTSAAEPAHGALAGIHALAMPLVGRHDDEGGGETLGAISIARRGGDFTIEQCDLLAYLTTQAAVSLENVDLHQRVSRQAITDELTGLSNVRHFHELLDQEIERAQRFDNHIGLVMVDIDNFKSVNDTYGHPQGDLVLKEVARVLQEQSRDIDFPARYGGEEMSVILPQTDIGGAAMLAERMREAIEELEVRRLDGQGVLKMTASFGVAALPGSATDKRYLIAVADEALYRAKHAGKNRVERAEPTPGASSGSR
jgi:diguanylate cyclase (GGDEF)-like protein